MSNHLPEATTDWAKGKGRQCILPPDGPAASVICEAASRLRQSTPFLPVGRQALAADRPTGLPYPISL